MKRTETKAGVSKINRGENETPHQERGLWKAIEARNNPEAAGLKIWRLSILKKSLIEIAKREVVTTSYHLEEGSTSKPIIKPVTNAAEGKIKFIFLILTNIKSANSADEIDSINKLRV